MPRCIFCKVDSTSSKSVEHIVPQSLGNTKNVLPRGIVCDSCNNYFAGKVEKPVLESGLFSSVRNAQAIPSKKGRVPPVKGFLSPGVEVDVHRNSDGETHVRIRPEDWDKVVSASSSGGTLIVPTSGKPPPQGLFSRFLAKMALEALAQRLSTKDGLDYIVDECQFDPVRDHARRGASREVWNYHERRIYDVSSKQKAPDGTEGQVLHEYDLVWIPPAPPAELYFVVAILGVEYTINVGGPSIDGYLAWLGENNDASPLYPDNAS